MLRIFLHTNKKLTHHFVKPFWYHAQMKIKEFIPTESQEAKLLMAWASRHQICRKYLIAIPNGGFRNAREALSLKKQGVKSGVSDYFLAYPNSKYHGLWIELKRRRTHLGRPMGKVSKAQEDWINQMKLLDYGAIVSHGANEAISVIQNYLTIG